MVLRRLPFGMTQEELLEQLGDSIKIQKGFYFVKADIEMKPQAFARAYFVFSDESQAIAFCRSYNGYVFVDKQGIILFKGFF